MAVRTTPNVQTQATGPSALPRDLVAAFADRRRQATRSFEEALAHQGAERGRADMSLQRSQNQLGRQMQTARFDGMSGLAEQGQARQPRFAGRMLRSLRDTEAQQRGELTAGHADRLSALEEMVQKARRQRDQEFLSIDADRTRAGTDLGRLFDPQVR